MKALVGSGISLPSAAWLPKARVEGEVASPEVSTAMADRTQSINAAAMPIMRNLVFMGSNGNSIRQRFYQHPARHVEESRPSHHFFHSFHPAAAMRQPHAAREQQARQRESPHYKITGDPSRDRRSAMNRTTGKTNGGGEEARGGQDRRGGRRRARGWRKSQVVPLFLQLHH